MFSNWQELAKRPKLANVVVIVTLDNLYAELTIAFAILYMSL
ncbi:3702_t:CDS:2 [Acaulospora morrowiae]|uniref:3702_t:CDS:1 n=1 Tax=Acaulospora morrowiae TaxID=94023 RepID=A0A9N9A0J9_9GLOM|nr:3702_t:CDS:2 [Acaulospora morrowiae]